MENFNQNIEQFLKLEVRFPLKTPADFQPNALLNTGRF